MVVRALRMLVSVMRSVKSVALALEGFSGREGVRRSCTRIHGVCCAVVRRLSLTIGRRVASSYRLKVWPILTLLGI